MIIFKGEFGKVFDEIFIYFFLISEKVFEKNHGVRMRTFPLKDILTSKVKVTVRTALNNCNNKMFFLSALHSYNHLELEEVF